VTDERRDEEERLREASAVLEQRFQRVDVSDAVMSRLAAHARPRKARRSRERAVLRPAWASAVVVALVVAVVAALPSTRSAVARWLGVRGVDVRIEEPPVDLTLPPVSQSQSPSPTSAPGAVLFGAPVTEEEAERRTGLRVPAIGALGAPDAVYVDERARGGGIIAVYASSPGLPAAAVRDVGAIVQVVRGRLDRGVYVKFAGAGTVVETAVGEAPALFVGGESHPIAYVDEAGEPIHETARLAGPTLLWDVGELTLRLESELALDDAVTLAESIDIRGDDTG
jgi:hypothetical protein